ncbi:DUF5011 domain-containing protein, partial [Aquimarina sp. MMG015]|uniref:immunoglobulin-like domain-containing protein n=1 Tax=Aquimarina sp. MMG015 TaxID=2822689 RepID=UPI001B3A2B60
MIKKIHTLLFFLSISVVGYGQQCGILMKPVSLQDRIDESTLVVEGEVKAFQSYWDTSRSNIYTVFEIEVYKVAKGSSSTTVKIAVLGGQVDNEIQMTSSSVSLYNRDLGIFMLKASKATLPLKGTIYDMVAAAQGFVRYDKVTNKASDVFYTYPSVKNELYSKIQKTTRAAMKVLQQRPVVLENRRKALLATPSISGISPSSISAGTLEVLTINGSNFGTVQGTVSFQNANTGGTTYFDAFDSQVLSWTDTEIQVQVPSGAGTGNIRVTNSDPATVTSSQTLTVRYNHLNATGGGNAFPTTLIDDNANGGFTFEYHIDFDTSSAKPFFEDAFELWNCETAVNFVFGTTTTTDVTSDDGINIIRFDNGSELASGVLGQVTTRLLGSCSVTGRAIVDELDITWNDSTNWYYGSGTPPSGQVDFKSVALHELGHAHQLGHVIDSNVIMHYNLGAGVEKYALNSNDIEGANFTMGIFTQSVGCSNIGAMTEYSQCCSALAITSSPSNHDDCEGESASFSISGTEISMYQWQVNTGSSWSNISDNSNYSNSDTATLMVNNPTFSFNGYQYRCIAENTCGDQLTSNAATMTIDELPSATVGTSNASCTDNDGEITFTFPDNAARTDIEFSIDNGGSYPYSYSDNVGSATINNIAAGSYDVWVRWDNDECPVDLGEITIDQEVSPNATVVAVETSCGADNGALNFTFSDVGTRTVIQFSINNGTSYDYTFNDNAGSGSVPGLAAGNYDVWVSYDNDDCPVDLGQFTIDASLASSASITTSTNETVCDANDGTIELLLVDNPSQTTVEVSLNGGTSYDYTFNDNSGSVILNNLTPGSYEIWSRWGDDSCAELVGTVEIMEAQGILTTISAIHAEVGQSDGRLLLTFSDDASQSQIKFSIDGGNTYPYTFDDSVGAAEISDLAANTYNVWASYGDDTCPTDQGDTIISEIVYSNIPDNNFENELNLLGYDNYVGDNRVPTSLINTITNLTLTAKNISDFTGIQDFVELTELKINSNAHTTLDVTNLTKLRRLETHSNSNLTSINVGGLTALEILRFNNTGVASYDVSTNTALQQLWAFSLPNVTTVDVSNNNLLWRLLIQKCDINQDIDLSHLSNLTWLSAFDNDLTGLNVQNGNNVNVTNFELSNNPNLNCIQVDNVSFSETAWTDIDAQTNFAVDCSVVPVISLTGNNPQTIELGDGYTELGATTDDGSVVRINATEFMDAVGAYTIFYDAINNLGNSAVQVTRTVNVVDTTAPVITLIGDNPQEIELGAGYSELGATTDDGSLIGINTLNFIDAIGSYVIRYNATDLYGNMAVEVIRTVNVVDTTAPVITLIGDNPQIVELGTGYTELGATADDGTNVVINSSDFVDAVGSYTITYNATDIFGNTAEEVSRTVNVVDTTTPPVITLLGDNPQEIELGAGYTELGATTDDGTNVVINSSDFVD